MSKTGYVVKVWDLPTRVFHWSLVTLMGLLWWSGENGEMELHQIFAYSLLCLIVFRWCWGVIGSESARFSHFVTHPIRAWQYFVEMKRAKAKEHAGHNPIGGYMVVTLLIIISLQIITGLFATDDIYTEGPLYSYVSSETAEVLTWLHKKLFDAVLVLTVLHVLAVVIHTLKGENLVPAMLHGKKKLKSKPERQLIFRSSMLAFTILGSLLAVVGYYLILPLLSQL